jgi:hypothetical protein
MNHKRQTKIMNQIIASTIFKHLKLFIKSSMDEFHGYNNEILLQIIIFIQMSLEIKIEKISGKT